MRNTIIASLVIGLLSFVPLEAGAQSEVRFISDPPQDIHARFRIFRTENIVTSIELDSRTGQLWQVQIGTGAGSKPEMAWINNQSLLPTGEKENDGRFTLYPTENMFNFLLVDQVDGRIWQCQWSVDKKIEDYTFCL